MKAIPLYSSDLIKELDKDYPDRCPSMKDSERDVCFKIGQRDVVSTLLALQKSEENRRQKKQKE
jgi:hypothetical protein